MNGDQKQLTPLRINYYQVLKNQPEVPKSSPTLSLNVVQQSYHYDSLCYLPKHSAAGEKSLVNVVETNLIFHSSRKQREIFESS